MADPARYSVYSELVDFRRKREHSVHLVVRNAALNADVLYFQSRFRFPSWTSRVRVPSPAPYFQ